MSASEIERNILVASGGFKASSSERIQSYQKAIERFNDLEKRGLLEKRGNTLLPIEERHKPILIDRNDRFRLQHELPNKTK